MHERKYTALNIDTQKLWNEQLAKGIEKGWKPKTILDQAEKEINRRLADLASKVGATAPQQMQQAMHQLMPLQRLREPPARQRSLKGCRCRS